MSYFKLNDVICINTDSSHFHLYDAKASILLKHTFTKSSLNLILQLTPQDSGLGKIPNVFDQPGDLSHAHDVIVYFTTMFSTFIRSVWLGWNAETITRDDLYKDLIGQMNQGDSGVCARLYGERVCHARYSLNGYGSGGIKMIAQQTKLLQKQVQIVATNSNPC